MTDVELFGARQSTYMRVAWMTCEEKGAPYLIRPAMPHSPEIKAMHPFGRIPAMRHGDPLRIQGHRHLRRPHVRRLAADPARSHRPGAGRTVDLCGEHHDRARLDTLFPRIRLPEGARRFARSQGDRGPASRDGRARAGAGRRPGRLCDRPSAQATLPPPMSAAP